MNKITTNKKDLEFKCNLIYYTEGLKIAKKLKQVILFGNYKNCIGLAHNQIKGNKSVFVAKINNKWETFINATIINKSNEVYKTSEGCMSFPNKPNKVIRHKWVEIKHQVKARNDVKGNAFITEKFYGFEATIIQHEIDHLNGIHIHNK